MNKIVSVCIMLAFFQTGFSQVRLDQYMKSLFLNGPIDSGFNEQVAYYKKQPSVVYSQVNNNTSFIDQEGVAVVLKTDRFVFKNHPLESINTQGSIDITITLRDSVERYFGTTILLNFDTEEAAKKIYRQLIHEINALGVRYDDASSIESKRSSIIFGWPTKLFTYQANLSQGPYYGKSQGTYYVSLQIANIIDKMTTGN